MGPKPRKGGHCTAAPAAASLDAHHFLYSLAVLDASGVFVYANPSCLRLLGAAEAELLGKPLAQFCPEPDAARQFADAVPGRDFTMELQARRGDGSTFDVLLCAHPFSTQGSRYCLAVFLDVEARMRTEEKRSALEDRLHLAVKAANVGLFDRDMRTGNCYYSPEWKRQIGYEDHEISHRVEEWQERVHPDDWKWLSAELERYIRNPWPDYQAEFRFRHKDGSYRWILVQAAVLQDAEGKPARMLGSHIDITERKRIDQALKQSEARFRQLVESSPIGIFQSDATGAITYVNPYILKLTGHAEAAHLLDNWVSIIHEEDRERVTVDWAAAVEERQRLEQELRLRRLDGTVVWIVSEANPEFDEQGRLNGFIGSVRDITDIRRAEAGLLASEHLLRQIFDTEPECIKVLDPQGRLLEINPAGIAALEADSAVQLEGRTIVEFVAPEYRAAFQELHARVLAGGSGLLEFDAIGLKGTRRRMETHAVPLRGENREVTALLAVTRDITEQHRAESVLRESEARYRNLFDHNPNPMCVTDRTTLRFLAVNEAMVQHYGYSHDEFLAMTLREIRPPEDLPLLLEAVKRTGNTLSLAGPLRHRKKNGDLIDVEVRARFIEWGGRDAVIALVSDITEARRAEVALAREQAALRETTTRLNHLLTTSPTILYSTRIKGGNPQPLWISDSVTRLLGYSREEALQPEWWPAHLHPEDRERVLATVPVLLDRGYLANEYRFLRKDGYSIWIRDEVRVLSEPGAQDVEVVGTWSDITQRRETEELLRLGAAAIESTHDGVMITTLDSVIVSVNRSFRETMGYDEFELLGQTPRLLQSGRHGQDFYQILWDDLVVKGSWQGEIWNRRKNGEVFPVWVTISAVRNERDLPTHYVAVYTDITKLKQSEEELERLAHFDPLTSLPNRLLLQSRLEHAVDQAQRRRRHVGVLFIDLDDFKKINDSLGHIIGDELLVAVANRLRERVRSEDTLARLGGDEFVVLLEELPRAEGAATVARDLISALAKPFALSSGHELYVQASIGISIFPDDGTTPGELLRDADTAMYRAKDSGGAGFLFFTGDMSEQAMADLDLENGLRQALDRGELLIYYQPKLDLKTGRIRGAEALLRWKRGSTLVSPNDFIPVAEKTGLIVPIGSWVIDQACRQLREWLKQGMPEIYVAVNVSALQFRSGDLESTISSTLARHGLPPHLLTLELTESMLMERPDEATQTLKRLKGTGVRLSLDDFGTGFSSLAYLTRFPVDNLKIDRSFVSGVGSDLSATMVVHSVIELAHRMGMQAIAEGVETREQLGYMKEKGCDAVQGFLLGRPMPADDFAKFLHDGGTPGSQ